jgi:thymidylate synthase
MKATKKDLHESGRVLSKEEFINKIKTDDEFAKKWGELGPVYGRQWRNWNYETNEWYDGKNHYEEESKSIDQIQNSINLLKTDPDSRRNKVSAWNVGELDQMTLPPCHTDFQFYTRELSETDGLKKINLIVKYKGNNCKIISYHNANHEVLVLETPEGERIIHENQLDEPIDYSKFPTRAISLMFNMRSTDVPLGLPFNIASYGLLLEIIAKIVNMVPDELIGNLGDTHIYLNQIEGCKEQIGRELTLAERMELWEQLPDRDVMDFPIGPLTDGQYHDVLNQLGVPTTTRNPYPLSTLNINTEFWPTKSGECGVGELTDNIDFLIKEMRIEDFQIENYQSHPAIKMPLSN